MEITTTGVEEVVAPATMQEVETEVLVEVEVVDPRLTEVCSAMEVDPP
tara:strand:+ start:384 stop:527 length:144 start_codon:yes stop_codon:yes gene_type:complete